MLLKHKAYSNSQNPDEWATLKNKIQQVANPGMEINTYKHNENDAKIQELNSRIKKRIELICSRLN